VAHRSGDDLLYGGLAAREARCIILRGEIAYQRGDAKFRPEQAEGFLEQHRLTGTRTRNEAYDEHAGIVEPLAKSTRDNVILLEYILADLNNARPAVHSSLREGEN
jgi:hypothetical protein